MSERAERSDGPSSPVNPGRAEEPLRSPARYLENDGFRISVAHDGQAAVGTAVAEQPDIAVFDVMMPAFSGIEVLRRIRAQSSLAILMLTAKGDEDSRVLGLEPGADD